MALLILSFVIFCMTVISVGYFYFDICLPFTEKKKVAEKPKEHELSYPEEFLNKVKRSLPLGKGFIYEVSTSMDNFDDLIVRVNVIDPVEDKELTTIKFDSSHGLGSVEGPIERALMSVYKQREVERLAGQTEIIS